VIRVGSLNVNGGILSKVQEIADIFDKYQLTVLGIQELKYNKDSPLSKFISTAFIKHGIRYIDLPSESKQYGTVILVKKGYHVHSIIAQHLQVTGVRLSAQYGKTKTYLNVYSVYSDASNDGSKEADFISLLEKYLEHTNTNDQLCVISGDWNGIINREDIINPNHDINQKYLDFTH
jgi:exonuclease III